MSDKKSKNQNKRQVGPTITLHSDPNDKNNKKKKNRDDVLLDHFNFAKGKQLLHFYLQKIVNLYY